MKITIDIDCTPAEARAFMGLPDLSGANQVVTSSLEEKMKEQIDTISDPVKFWERAIMSGGQSMEAFQAAFAKTAAAPDKG
jgi:hypothetical protein